MFFLAYFLSKNVTTMDKDFSKNSVTKLSTRIVNQSKFKGLGLTDSQLSNLFCEGQDL